jgi:ankyrin repeat protein
MRYEEIESKLNKFESDEELDNSLEELDEELDESLNKDLDSLSYLDRSMSDRRALAIVHMLSILKDHEKLAEFLKPLLNDPAEITDRDKSNIIFTAVRVTDNVALLKLILETWNIDVNSVLYGRCFDFDTTLLHEAVCHNRINITKFLIEKGISVNIVDGAGDTSLNTIHMINSDSDPHHPKNTDFYNPQNIEMIEYLLSQGADLDATNEEGETFFTLTSRSYYNQIEYLSDRKKKLRYRLR